MEGRDVLWATLRPLLRLAHCRLILAFALQKYLVRDSRSTVRESLRLHATALDKRRRGDG